MSTFVTNTSSGPRPSITVRPHTDIPRRRKASEIDDAEDEPARPTKKFKQSHGPEQASALLRPLGIVLTSLHISASPRCLSPVRAGSVFATKERLSGCVTIRLLAFAPLMFSQLRNRFIKSLRNIPVQPDNTGSAQFAFTFVPAPFRPRQDAMEDIEESLSTMDIDLVVQTSPVFPQHLQVPMSIDGPQTVGSTEVSASISTLDTEMEIVSEHVLARDAAASPSGDEDKVMVDAPQVAVPDVKSFISRFLARAAAAATAVPRQATPFKKTIQPKGAIRGVGKTSSRKIHAAATPYARTGRRQALTSAPRSSKSRNAPDNLLHHLTATTPSAIEPLIPSDNPVASAAEAVVHSAALEILEGSPAPVDENDLEKLLADTKDTSEAQEIEVFYDALEGMEHEVSSRSSKLSMLGF